MPRRPSGPAMSIKQMVKTVVDGKIVTVYFAKDDFLTGYLCGMDDYNWMIVESSGERHIIHKASAIRITLGQTSTLADEQNFKTLDKIIAPFRRYVEATFFGRGDGIPAA